MTRIVTSTYRYKRPPPKRKAVALEVPAIVSAKSGRRQGHEAAAKSEESASTKDRGTQSLAQPDANDSLPRAQRRDRKPTIITIRRKPARVLPPGLLPETPEEHKRRGDGADAMFQAMKRRIAERVPA